MTLDICNFDNLQIKAALLDDIFKDPESPSKDHILNIDSKSLRDTRSNILFFIFVNWIFWVDILSQVGLDDGFQFVDQNPHPRLWKLVADQALEKLNFNVAQKALVRGVDYKGLQFLKKLRKLNVNSNNSNLLS